MRIGIVSVFDNNNLGNRLQNYALQQVLLSYADEVVTIKNKPYYSGKSRVARMLPFAESVLLNRLLGMDKRAKLIRFTKKYIPFTQNCYWYDTPEMNLKRRDLCDLYCAGSDQVWNPEAARYTMFNYLGFSSRDNTFSYAASFGVDEVSKEYREAVQNGLRHVKYISVREEAGKQITEKLTGRTDVQVLVDPTMLLTVAQWDLIGERPKFEIPEKYLLSYFVGDVTDERRSAVRNRAKMLGYEFIDLNNKRSPYYAIGPGEFIWLIKNAAIICTDSFHGSIFSFLYQRPLIIFNREGSRDDMSSRLETLASKFHLQGCMAEGDTLPDISGEADYSAGYEVLEQERKKSKAFLDMVFEEAERAGLCD